jgi:hypothetical protein
VTGGFIGMLAGATAGGVMASDEEGFKGTASGDARLPVLG